MCGNEWPHIQSGMTWHAEGKWVQCTPYLVCGGATRDPLYFWVPSAKSVEVAWMAFFRPLVVMHARVQRAGGALCVSQFKV